MVPRRQGVQAMTDDQDIERGAGEGEGSEAEGVERLEATATLPPEQGHELDRATLDELDEDQRAEPAADLQFASGNPSQWTAEAERLMPSRGGIGTYPTFTHVDIRPNRARWY